MTTQSPSEVRPQASWPQWADCPQRYFVNYQKYLAQGGLVRPEDVAGFVAESKNKADMARFYFFCLAFDQLVKEGVTGDIAELGVYKGSTASLLANFARRLGSIAYLLDTYEGFDRRDLVGIDETARLESFQDTSLAAVRALVGEDSVRFVQGHFPATASQLPPDGSYCLVHLDCDLYAPMASALEYFYSKLVPGGFLIVHDYSSLHWSGAEKAVDEFFADKTEAVVPLPDSSGSVTIRKARPAGSAGNWLVRKRRTLLGPDWSEAGHGKLAGLLDAGWSGPEAWGVWGVGESHTLLLPVPDDPAADLVLDLDVAAGLVQSRPDQTIDVVVLGETLATWRFTLQQNRGVRRLIIPATLIDSRNTGRPVVTITLHPHSVRRNCDFIPGSSDTRSVGLGLHRLRIATRAA